jgi:hypothetical protein
MEMRVLMARYSTGAEMMKALRYLHRRPSEKLVLKRSITALMKTRNTRKLSDIVCENWSVRNSIKNRVAKIRKWMYDLSGTNLNEVETIYKWKSEI